MDRNYEAAQQARAAEITALKDTVQNLTAEVADLTARNAELQRKLERMNELLRNAQQARFGQSSEKRTYVLPDSDQLCIFNEAESLQSEKAPEPTPKTLVNSHKRKPKRTIDEMAADLPVKKVVLDLSEEEKICAACGNQLRPIGQKFVRRELQIIPRQVYVVEYYSRTYACKHCESETGFASISSAPAPPALLKHSLASPETVAAIMAQKYIYGLPLARQEELWKAEGYELSRATMANWIVQCAQKYLSSVYRLIRNRLLSCHVIHADETEVQVHREKGKKNSTTSYMWVYASGRFSNTPIRYFEYQPGRSGDYPQKLLKNFKGCLITDGYSGYNKVHGVVRCACWAHMRRKWREAMPAGATLETSKAAVGYEYCNKIFVLEQDPEMQTDDLSRRVCIRREKSAVVLAEYWAFVEGLNPAAGSKLMDAVVYARNHKDELSAFLNYGDVDISNNLAENAIRPFVVGRKNWLFCDTPEGADASAIIYTLVETAKANDLDPSVYLAYLLDRIRYLGKVPAPDDLTLFLPWNPDLKDLLNSHSEVQAPA